MMMPAICWKSPSPTTPAQPPRPGEVNDLNQIDTATGGWEFLYDDNGCLIEKNNGTGVGDKKWEFSWNEDDA